MDICVSNHLLVMKKCDLKHMLEHYNSNIMPNVTIDQMWTWTYCFKHQKLQKKQYLQHNLIQLKLIFQSKFKILRWCSSGQNQCKSFYCDWKILHVHELQEISMVSNKILLSLQDKMIYVRMNSQFYKKFLIQKLYANFRKSISFCWNELEND